MSEKVLTSENKVQRRTSIRTSMRTSMVIPMKKSITVGKESSSKVKVSRRASMKPSMLSSMRNSNDVGEGSSSKVKVQRRASMKPSMLSSMRNSIDVGEDSSSKVKRRASMKPSMRNSIDIGEDSSSKVKKLGRNTVKRSISCITGNSLPMAKKKKVQEVIIPANLYQKLKDSPRGIVMTFGQGSTGQLGLGDNVFEKNYPGKVKLDDNSVLGDIVIVVAGGMHTLCLSVTGKVYSFGCNDEGALGRITDQEDQCFVPGLITALDEYIIVQMSAGDSHSVFLTDQGRVFATGTFRDANGSIGLTEAKRIEKEPVEILMPDGLRISKIASGLDHLVCLSVSGQLISMGCADQGQLGRVAEMNAVLGGRKGLAYLLTPAFVYVNKRNMKFTDIWTGQYNTYAKAFGNTCDVWSCGLNNYFQIGFDTTKSRFTLSQAKEFKCEEGSEIISVSGGQHHALALDSNGRVYSIGRHDYGRLGLGEINIEKKVPTEIKLINDISWISADTAVSFAIKQGILYSWGMGSNNQLGGKGDEDQLEPSIVTGKNVQDRKILQVSAGGQHVVILTEDDKIVPS